MYKRQDQRLSMDVEGIRVTINQERKESYTLLTISAEAKQGRCYLSFACEYPDGKLLTFSGEKSGVEVFRQSPHDPADHVLDMAKEAVPMVALTDGNGFIVALSDQPGHCDNYTTQYINTDQKEFRISSGDSGETPGYKGKEFLPYYHELREGKGHESVSYTHQDVYKRQDLDIGHLSTEELCRRLMSLKGVGRKVADCIALFGYQKIDVFPTDVWVKKAMRELYQVEGNEIDSFSSRYFGKYRGLAQQYLFYHMRCGI